MLGLLGRPKLPVSDEMRSWVDGGFDRLSKMLGRKRMMEAVMVLPKDRFFPDAYTGTKACVDGLAERVAAFMGVRCESYRVEIYAEDEDRWKKTVPLWTSESKDAAGLYFHRPEDGRFLVGLHAKQLSDPLALVGTLAHEFAHVLLLGGEMMDPDAPDMEPMTDLCTVYLGLGFFTASSAYRFKQWTRDGHQGWSTERKGYLTEEVWGYALARFAAERREMSPVWAKQLPTNVRSYFKRSQRWIAGQKDERANGDAAHVE
jgi:hypothetical protein